MRLNGRTGAGLRLVVSLALLALVLVWLEPAALLAAVGELSPAWLFAGLALSVPQFLLSAWRWQFTARRLGLVLPFRAALREYYLASLLNQLLPGGLLGDVARAHRHARAEAGGASAWHAVILERACGQLMLLLFALAALLFAPPQLGERLGAAWLATVAVLPGAVSAAAPLLVLALLAGVIVAGRRRLQQWLAHFARDAHRALLDGQALVVQLGLSLAIVASYVLVFVCCVRGLGLDTPLPLLLPLVVWVLVAMTAPVSVAGWGVREAAAALAWPLAGLPAAEGVASSIAYGAVVLVSTLPGLAPLLQAPPRQAENAARE